MLFSNTVSRKCTCCALHNGKDGLGYNHLTYPLISSTLDINVAEPNMEKSVGGRKTLEIFDPTIKYRHTNTKFSSTLPAEHNEWSFMIDVTNHQFFPLVSLLLKRTFLLSLNSDI